MGDLLAVSDSPGADRPAAGGRRAVRGWAVTAYQVRPLRLVFVGRRGLVLGQAEERVSRRTLVKTCRESETDLAGAIREARCAGSKRSGNQGEVRVAEADAMVLHGALVPKESRECQT